MGLTILPPTSDSDDELSISRQRDSHPSGRSSSPSSSVSDDGGMSLDHSSHDDSPRPTKRARISQRDIVVPGEPITRDTQWMRGHGTHHPYTLSDSSSTLISSTLLGSLTPTNKLLSVTPTRARYTPEIGDLVVGRIESLQQTSGNSRWKVDIAAPLLANLSMSSINLPGGALRRRNAQDELQMRNYFVEGEVLVAEVQIVNQEGVAGLHARSLRYGKLRNGVFLAVSGTGGGGGVVRSRRQQFTINGSEVLGGGDVDVILGVNGYIWLSQASGEEGDGTRTGTASTPDGKSAGSGGAKGVGGVDLGISNLDDAVSASAYSSQNDNIPNATRREIARISEVIGALVEGGVRVDEDAVRRGVETAVEYALTKPDDGGDVGMNGELGNGRELLNSVARKRIVQGVLQHD